MTEPQITLETSGVAAAGDLPVPLVPPGPPYRRRALKVAAFVFLVGPPAGSILYSVMIGASLLPDMIWGTGSTQPATSVSSLIFVTIFFAILSYFYGGLSALFSAIWLGVRTFCNGGFGYGEAVLTALVAGGAGALLVVFFIFQQRLNEPAGLLMLIGPGVFSALVCRWLLGYFAILPPASKQGTA